MERIEKPWHTSSYSGANSDCVEVAEGPVTGVRDTQSREAGHLAVPSTEWSALLGALRS